MIDFDKDELAVNNFIKANPSAFNSIDPFAVVSARSGLAELILDARIEERVKHTGETPEVAEEIIIKELEETKK